MSHFQDLHLPKGKQSSAMEVPCIYGDELPSTLGLGSSLHPRAGVQALAAKRVGQSLPVIV